MAVLLRFVGVFATCTWRNWYHHRAFRAIMATRFSPAIFATLMACEVLTAAPAATSQNVRGAVQRSLPYVEKVSTAWMREQKCNSCHNVTFLLWTHNEAAARGFDVDRAKLAQWTKWSL